MEADRENGQGEGTENDLRKLERCCREFNRRLLYIFRKEQDYFVRLNWHDEVLFPQEAAEAIWKLFTRHWIVCAREMLRAVWMLYMGLTIIVTPFQFDREVLLGIYGICA